LFLFRRGHIKVILFSDYYVFVVNLMSLCNITLGTMKNLLGKRGAWNGKIIWRRFCFALCDI